MAGDDVRKVSPGQRLRLPARAYNAFVDVALAHRNRSLDFGPYGADPRRRDGLVYIRNDAGEDLKPYAVLGIDGIVIQPEDNEAQFKAHPILIGVKPTKDLHHGRFALLAEPINQDKIGLAYLQGICPVRLKAPDDAEPGYETNRYADIEDEDTAFLRPTTSGAAQVLWLEDEDEDGGGNSDEGRWALVRLGRGPLLFPVRLEQTGGEEGTASAQTSWTYSVLDFLSGALLEEEVDPTTDPHQWRRPAVGAVSKATFGYAHYAKDGKLALGWINEMLEQEAC